jgi:hypothetical protein
VSQALRLSARRALFGPEMIWYSCAASPARDADPDAGHASLIVALSKAAPLVPLTIDRPDATENAGLPRCVDSGGKRDCADRPF